ncbi:MAG TPA: universal stress protein [Phenylobacterium sp.]|uniref:universal stress protein n=1 Tax=Phenylobacterium sp. TaxID=1871053 RepID=UPI002B4620D8|nr:universal stress protein [Phenylobacterium sp.]HKR86769.1 universal stress protein [Phenylobacterium sp.]HKT53481.1 universal stress protein [Caulobacteraceae bacterium]
MHNRVIVAYDGSREGRTALREGALLVRQLGAEMYILAVVPETPGMRVAEGAYAGAMAYQDDTYKTLLEEAVRGLGRFGLQVKGKLVRGEPAQEIAAYAREIKADLVIVGHRRQNLLQRWWSGPNGAYLSDYLTCSLLIAKADISYEQFCRAMGQEPEVTA